MIVKWHLETGMVGADREGEIEIEDDATDDQIDAAVREDMWNFLSLTWERHIPALTSAMIEAALEYLGRHYRPDDPDESDEDHREMVRGMYSAMMAARRP